VRGRCLVGFWGRSKDLQGEPEPSCPPASLIVAACFRFCDLAQVHSNMYFESWRQAIAMAKAAVLIDWGADLGLDCTAWSRYTDHLLNVDTLSNWNTGTHKADPPHVLHFGMH